MGQVKIDPDSTRIAFRPRPAVPPHAQQESVSAADQASTGAGLARRAAAGRSPARSGAPAQPFGGDCFAGLPVLHRLKIDELLQQRADRIDDALTPMLLDVKLPLPMHLGTVAQGLIGLRAELGETWLKVAGDADPKELGQGPSQQPRSACRESSICRGNCSPPADCDSDAHELLAQRPGALSRSPRGSRPDGDAAGRNKCDRRPFQGHAGAYRSPARRTAPREIAFLADYLETNATATRIDMIRPEGAGDWFWLDASLDQPPVALLRLMPDGGPCLYFRFGELAELAARHLDQLNDGVPPSSLGLAAASGRGRLPQRSGTGASMLDRAAATEFQSPCAIDHGRCLYPTEQLVGGVGKRGAGGTRIQCLRTHLQRLDHAQRRPVRLRDRPCRRRGHRHRRGLCRGPAYR
jgi:hypothetical protein